MVATVIHTYSAWRYYRLNLLHETLVSSNILKNINATIHKTQQQFEKPIKFSFSSFPIFRLNHTVAKALHSIFKDIISSHTTNIQLFLSGQILMVTFSSNTKFLVVLYLKMPSLKLFTVLINMHMLSACTVMIWFQYACINMYGMP